jgi:hypothetical protein
MRLIRNLALGAIVLGFGCSDPTSASIASSVTGSWKIPQTVPGSGFAMTLANNGSSLSGSGVVLVEAGPAFYSTVQGEVDGSVVNLDFTLVPNESHGGTGTVIEHFTGALIHGELRGTMTFSQSPETSPVPIVFVRQVPIPI